MYTRAICAPYNSPCEKMFLNNHFAAPSTFDRRYTETEAASTLEETEVVIIFLNQKSIYIRNSSSYSLKDGESILS